MENTATCGSYAVGLFKVFHVQKDFSQKKTPTVILGMLLKKYSVSPVAFISEEKEILGRGTGAFETYP